jgi:hypothetical protein
MRRVAENRVSEEIFAIYRIMGFHGLSWLSDFSMGHALESHVKHYGEIRLSNPLIKIFSGAKLFLKSDIW